MKSIILHYQEIALKGRNRPWFIARLVRNIREATADLDVTKVRALQGRIEVVLGDNADWLTVRDRLAKVFGAGNFARAGRARLDIDAIAAEILRDLDPQDPRSFRVSVRRADKRFPMTSPQIEREVGGRIKEARGWHVDLAHPEFTIHVETLSDEAFYFFGKHPGPGGLPVGVSGRVVCLLSGGIDSPVAAWRLMRRGCRVLFVHFHSYPILSRASQEKARELVRLLTQFQFRSRLFLVPFGEIQQQASRSTGRTPRSSSTRSTRRATSSNCQGSRRSATPGARRTSRSRPRCSTDPSRSPRRDRVPRPTRRPCSTSSTCASSAARSHRRS